MVVYIYAYALCCLAMRTQLNPEFVGVIVCSVCLVVGVFAMIVILRPSRSVVLGDTLSQKENNSPPVNMGSCGDVGRQPKSFLGDFLTLDERSRDLFKREYFHRV